jgi:regulator of RNase E activity RraA
MAAMEDTAQRRPATAVRIARRVTGGGVCRRPEGAVVADARTEVAVEHARTEVEVAVEHARTEAAEVVDILVAEAAMQEVAATPAAATANDRDKDLDVRSKLCH